MNARLIRLLLCHAVLGMGIVSAGSIDVVFDSSRFGTIDTSTGAYTQISNIPLNEAAGIAAGLNTLYVEDIYSNLLSIDPNTGIATLVGNSGLNLTVPVFGGGSGGFFELDTASNLYSVSTSTGKATLIGATGMAANNFSYDTSLSSDGASLLYTAGKPGAAGELYRINTTTGKATDLGNTGVKGVAGSAFDNGQLDLFQYGQATNYIYSAADGSDQFTRGTAVSTVIIDGGAALAVASNSQVGSSTPEPGTFAMGLAGALMVIKAALRARSPQAV